MTAKVAIIGRPNVGKSTLFNRLVGRRLALVDDTPGVTRDRREGTATLSDLTFQLIDTAGLEEADANALEGRMLAQTEAAVDSADVCLFLVDARAGITPQDEHFADWLRRRSTPVVLVANKGEGKAADGGVLESYALGFGDPVRVSAEHGEGLSDLYQALRPYVEKDADTELAPPPDSDVIRVAILGRPNVGKSTLINTLVGENRLLSGPEAGLTRDSITVPWRSGDYTFELVDTAGIRKRARVTEKLEKLAVADGLRAMEMAHVVVLLIDASGALDRQDRVIADRVLKEGRALIVGLNKWDLVEEPQKRMRELKDDFDRFLPQVRGVPMLTLCATTGRGTEKLAAAIHRLMEKWNFRASTSVVNRWLEKATQAHPPPAPSGRRIKMRFATQVATRPPTVVVFCSRPKELPESYTRYLINDFRDTFKLEGVVVRVRYQKGENPYAETKSR